MNMRTLLVYDIKANIILPTQYPKYIYHEHVKRVFSGFFFLDVSVDQFIFLYERLKLYKNGLIQG